MTSISWRKRVNKTKLFGEQSTPLYIYDITETFYRKENSFGYNRKTYLEHLSQWKDKPLIKIITGLRRSGKSTLVKLFIDSLLNSGIGAERIFYINKESLQFQHIATYEDLY